MSDECLLVNDSPFGKLLPTPSPLWQRGVRGDLDPTPYKPTEISLQRRGDFDFPHRDLSITLELRHHRPYPPTGQTPAGVQKFLKSLDSRLRWNDFNRHVPRTTHEEPSTKHQEPSTKNQAPRTKHQEPSTKNEARGTKHACS